MALLTDLYKKIAKIKGADNELTLYSRPFLRSWWFLSWSKPI